MQETQVWSLGPEDPLGKEMATHSNILVWKIPRTEESGGVQSMGLKNSQKWLSMHACTWLDQAYPDKSLYFILFYFFSSTSLLLPTHLPPPSCTHAQSCNPMDFSPPDSSVSRFFQARILEWVAISFSKSLYFNINLGPQLHLQNPFTEAPKLELDWIYRRCVHIKARESWKLFESFSFHRVIEAGGIRWGYTVWWGKMQTSVHWDGKGCKLGGIWVGDMDLLESRIAGWGICWGCGGCEGYRLGG